jgi:hypothetical protein
VAVAPVVAFGRRRPLTAPTVLDVATFVATVIAAVLAVGLVLLVRRIRATRSVLAAEVLVYDRPPAEVDGRLRSALAGLAGARVAPLEPGHVRVILRRSPPWTLVVAILAFPLGLIAALYREDVPLDVWVYATPGGTQVQLSGRTEAHVLQRVRAAALTVPGLRAGQAVGV